MAGHKNESSTERYRTDNLEDLQKELEKYHPLRIQKKKLISYLCRTIMRIPEPYKDYFWEFYNPLPQKVKDKVDYVLQIVISVQRISTKFFKHLEDEIRIEVGYNIYRIF